MLVKRENSEKSRDKALEKGISWEKNPTTSLSSTTRRE